MRAWRAYARGPAWAAGRRRTCISCGAPARVFAPNAHFVAYCVSDARRLGLLGERPADA